MVKIQEGTFSRQNGDFARSTEQLHEAVRLAEETNDSWTLVEALTELSSTHAILGQFTSALDVLARAGEWSRKAGDLLSESNALSYQAVAAFHGGEYAQAHQSAIEAERLCRLIDNRSLLPWNLYVQAAESFTGGEYRRTIEILQELRLLFADLGNPRNIATVDIALGAAFAAAGELAEASSTFLVAIPAIRRYGFREDKIMGLFEVAFLASASGQHKRAARLFAASEAHARQVGQTLNRSDEQRKSAAIASLQTILGANVFEIEWTAGLNLDLEDAFALAQLTGDEPIELAS
jgi:tetratricopeptide (TPR) repeat protein